MKHETAFAAVQRAPWLRLPNIQFITISSTAKQARTACGELFNDDWRVGWLDAKKKYGYRIERVTVSCLSRPKRRRS